MTQTTRLVACLGMIAGSLAISTVARADIPITGGQATGDAAFFTGITAPATTPGATPGLTRTGAPVLFDTAIRSLRIVTPNGTTTTSRFLPNASRFTDNNNNNRPDAGDKGRLEGALSGVAFNSSGFPVFFQNVPTALDFTLTSFNPAFLNGGSLISPKQAGTAPLVFIPGVNVQLSTQSSATFDSRLGLLETGPFTADLTGDFIGLPSDLQLRPGSGDVTLLPVALGRRIKFDFKGKDARVEEAGFGIDPVTGARVVGYQGEVTDFQIQSVGTPGTREFKITGAGTLDIALTGPFDIKKDDLNLNTLTGKVDYEIKGEGPGFVAFTGANSVAYSGTSRRATNFKFEQGSKKFEGKSDGDISFILNNTQDGVNFNSFTIPAVGITTTTIGAPFVSSPTGGGSGGGVSSTSSSSSSFFFSTTVFNSSSTVIFPGYRNLIIENQNDDDNDDDDNDSGRYGNNVVYYVYAPRKPVTEVVVERQGDRILIVDRSTVRGRKLKKRGQVIGAYQVVGLPSRVFPGMTGLREIPPEQVETTTGTTGDDADDNNSSTTPSSTTPSSTTPSSTTPSSTTPSGTTEGSGTGTSTGSGTNPTP